MTALQQVLEAARALSAEDQDTLVARLLEWQAEAERSALPVWIGEEELSLVRQGLAQADRGETLDARAVLDQLRRGG